MLKGKLSSITARPFFRLLLLMIAKKNSSPRKQETKIRKSFFYNEVKNTKDVCNKYGFQEDWKQKKWEKKSTNKRERNNKQINR